MRKFLSILIMLAMIAGIAACDKPTVTKDPGSSESTQSSSEVESSFFPEEELPRFKIGVVYSSFTDKLGSQFKSALESLADDFNIEFQFLETGISSEGGQAAVEAALQADMDGILTAGVDIPTLEKCKDAGVALVSYCNEIPESAFLQAKEYDEYLGAVSDSNYNIGVNAAKALHEAGVKKIGVCGLTPGLAANHDDRLRGFKDQMKEYTDMEILVEQLSLGKFGETIASFAAAYPEMDGLFTTASAEATYQSIATEGLTDKIKFATVDISDSTPDFFDSETLAYIAGGQYGTIMVSFAVLYNYLYDGTRIIPDVTEAVYRDHIEIHNSDEYQKYVEIVDGDVPVYTPEEIAEMIIGFNDDFTFADLETLCEEFSLDEVQSRR